MVNRKQIGRTTKERPIYIDSPAYEIYIDGDTYYKRYEKVDVEQFILKITATDTLIRYEKTYAKWDDKTTATFEPLEI